MNSQTRFSNELIRLSFLLHLLALTSYAFAQTNTKGAPTDQDSTNVLEVIDSFLELHKGPGRSYAVFFVVEQGEQIQVLTRRPDWYEVRTLSTAAGGAKTGWVKATQIARTLQRTGEPADLPDISYGDYAKNRWRFGFTVGQISSTNLENGDIFGGNIAYYPTSWVGAELEGLRFFSADVRGTQLNINLILEPFSQWRISPAVILGTGTTEIGLQPVIASVFDFEKESHNAVGLRLNYYAGRNFIVRGEYRTLSLPTNNNDEEIDIWNFGFSTLF